MKLSVEEMIQRMTKRYVFVEGKEGKRKVSSFALISIEGHSLEEISDEIALWIVEQGSECIRFNGNDGTKVITLHSGRAGYRLYELLHQVGTAAGGDGDFTDIELYNYTSTMVRKNDKTDFTHYKPSKLN